jgi:hypothetical protein
MNARSEIHQPSRPRALASRVMRSHLVHAAFAIAAATWIVGVSVTTLSTAEASRLQTPRADTSAPGSLAETILLPVHPYSGPDVIAN